MPKRSLQNTDRSRGGRNRGIRGRGGLGATQSSRGNTHRERGPAAFRYTDYDYEDDFRDYEEQDPQIGSSKSFKNRRGYWIENTEMLVTPAKSPKAPISRQSYNSSKSELQQVTVSRVTTKKNKKQNRFENTETDAAGEAAFVIREPGFEKNVAKKQSGQSAIAGASKYAIMFTKAAVGLNMENQDQSEDLESEGKNEREEKQILYNHESDEEILMQAFEWTEEDANPPSAQVVTQSQAGLRLDEEEGSGDDVENTRTTGLDIGSARVSIGWGGALAYSSNNSFFTDKRDSSAYAINRDTVLTSSTMQTEVEDRDILDTIIKQSQIVLEDDIETTVYIMNSNGGFDLEEKEDKHTVQMIRPPAVEERDITEEVAPAVEVGWFIDTQGDLNAHSTLNSPQILSKNTTSGIFLSKELTLSSNVISQEHKQHSGNDNFISVALGKEVKMQKKAKKKAQRQEQRWRKRALGRSNVAQSDEFVSKRKGKMAIIRGDDIDLGDSEDDSELEALVDYMQNTSAVDDYDLVANEQLLKALEALNLPQGDNVDLDDEESEPSSNSENDDEESEWSSNSDNDGEISDDDIDGDDDYDEEYDLKYFAGHFGWDDELWLPEYAEGGANAKVRKEKNEQFQRILNGAFDEVPPSLQADFGKYPVLCRPFNNIILSLGFKARLQRKQKKGKLATSITGYSNEVNQSALSPHEARRRDLEKKRKAEKKNARSEKKKMAKGKSQGKRSIDLRKTDRFSILTKTPQTLIPTDRRDIERLINETRTEISANSSILRHQRMSKIRSTTDIRGTRGGAGNTKIKANVKKKGKENATESSSAAARLIDGAVVGERARPLGEGNVGHRMLAAMGPSNSPSKASPSSTPKKPKVKKKPHPQGVSQKPKISRPISHEEGQASTLSIFTLPAFD
ncbi:hypothetical protein BC937DRAFT_92324 [Endogone sp. FLAS-F59071]|nr:hypothetical protein BC937DRAFT_92324 [Endogone sp. FLAS-F59071]|eukprot:RUS23110.1 hypothetical protein BC937DRAFT_92324 [Endogone sp. FLAS-F59071]